MKWVKKVASTPLDTIAKVINSFNSGDDKTTNAPSIKAVSDALAAKVDKVAGKGLSTNDYSDAEKTKVDATTYNDFGEAVDLASYTWQNPYVFPSDGYVVFGALGTNATCSFHLINSAGGTVLASNPVLGYGGGGDTDFKFVKKGMQGFYSGAPSNSNGWGRFYPLISNN